MAGEHRIFRTPFADVYPLYVAKVERKGRSRSELDAVIAWLTGYGAPELEAVIRARVDLGSFLRGAPAMNPAREQVRGVVCGVRVEDVEDPLMRELRRLDKLVDELAKGRPLEKVFRRAGAGGSS